MIYSINLNITEYSLNTVHQYYHSLEQSF